MRPSCWPRSRVPRRPWRNTFSRLPRMRRSPSRHSRRLMPRSGRPWTARQWACPASLAECIQDTDSQTRSTGSPGQVRPPPARILRSKPTERGMVDAPIRGGTMEGTAPRTSRRGSRSGLAQRHNTSSFRGDAIGGEPGSHIPETGVLGFRASPFGRSRNDGYCKAAPRREGMPIKMMGVLRRIFICT